IRSVPNFPPEEVASAAYVLLKDHDPKAALPALYYATKEFPKIAAYQIWLAQALGQTGDRAGALTAYRKAAELLPSDGDDEAWRRNNKYLINKGLKELGANEPPPGGKP